MKRPNENLDRLLRLAAQTNEEYPTLPPFGFETRVVSLWRSGIAPLNGLNILLRRVLLLSAAVMVITTTAAVRELQQNRDVEDSVTNEFAIADSAIQTEFLK